MAQQKKFVVKTPRGQIYTQKTSGGTVMAKLEWSGGMAPRIEGNLSRAQCFVDSEVLRLSDPLTPRLTGALIKSGTLGTVIGSGEVSYNAPYARRQYYEHSGQGLRGSKWFERMKAANKDKILEGAEKIARGG